MAVLRTWAEVEAFDGGPTSAEMQLIDACKAGETCSLGSDLPDASDMSRKIRAEILRYLIIGGCKDCPVKGAGVWLIGGHITGDLDLDYARAHGATLLEKCLFENRFDSVQTQFKMVSLRGSELQGWFAQGIRVEGSIFLQDLHSHETIDLNSARVGGQITGESTNLNSKGPIALEVYSARIDGNFLFVRADISGSILLNGTTIGGDVSFAYSEVKSKGSYAISIEQSKIDGGVFLRPGGIKSIDSITKYFQCTGEIRLNSATIGGLFAETAILISGPTGQSLSLGGATVNGPVRLDGCDSTGEILLAGSRISGRLTCERLKLHNDKGHAFNGQAMRVDHSFVWKKVEHACGGVSLNGAHVAELDDHPDNWPGSEALFLDGFTYDRIKGTVSTSPARMDWLRAGSYFGEEFRPQPYSQYAKFLRDTGHDEDARRVLYTREKLRRASARAQMSASGHSMAVPLNLWSHFWGIMLRLVVGYGHYPFRSVAALAVLICATVLPAHFAWEEGSFAPNAAPITVSSDWTALAAEPHPAAVWSGERVPADSNLTLPDWKALAPGRDWESFNRYAYGFDVVIPIIDFGQTDAWAPSTTRGPVGWHLWWARWVLSVMGWIVTALGAAAITGIIRRE